MTEEQERALIRAALDLSTALVDAENDGMEIPDSVDDAWLELRVRRTSLRA